ncbi:ubiquitin HECT domain containing protein [Babesia ovata]|uniref:HECT-type E3 ubiquitin transferase n=1 Tax=Babesia ovata TaxID=189622 RepID=A0A2H6KGF3_9APIC|nr:ubiquitin HECT domain containing protein [Babesia ovata]GBE62080.1 ubiquitin HECT domain containing protein [Babesia ovata]
MLATLEAGGHVDQLLVLGELSNFLSYANEESLLGFPAWSYLKVLMHMIQHPRVKYASVKKRRNEKCGNGMSCIDPELPFYKMLSSIYKNRPQRQEVQQPVGGGQVAGGDDQAELSPITCPGLPAHVDPRPHELDPKPTMREPDVDLISEDMAANKAITAASCVNTILDILPHGASFFMSNSSQLEILQRKLEDIEYIDLAERILLIYEKLVKEIPVTVVKSGSLISMFKYVDFFPLDVQIGTLTAIMMAVKRIERGESVRNFLIPLFPFVSQAMRNGNKKIVQLACGIWKSIISTAVRASYKNESHSSEVIGSMVRSVVACDAVRDMCTLVFRAPGKLSRENVDQCLYCLAIVSNESNEVLSQIILMDVLPSVRRWLDHSNESMLLRLVDLGLGMLGSYHTIEPLITDCNQLYQRADYYSGCTVHLQLIAETYPIQTLVDIYDNTVSQQLRNRVLLLVLRLLEMAGEVPICVDYIITDLPVIKLVDAVCYTLRYQSQDEHSEVAVHIITCLLRLLEHTSIGDTMRRYGVSSLLTALNKPKLQHELKYILDSLPPPPKPIVAKSGFELITEIKGNNAALTLHELSQYGMLNMDYAKLLSPNSLSSLLGTVIRDSGKFVSPLVDTEGIQALWHAFGSVLESQPEFKPQVVKADGSDDEGTSASASPARSGALSDAMQVDPPDNGSSTSSSEAFAMFDTCTLSSSSVHTANSACDDGINPSRSTTRARGHHSGASSSSKPRTSSGKQLLISAAPGSQMTLVSELPDFSRRPEEQSSSTVGIDLQSVGNGHPEVDMAMDIVEDEHTQSGYINDGPQQVPYAASSLNVAADASFETGSDGIIAPMQDSQSVSATLSPTVSLRIGPSETPLDTTLEDSIDAHTQGIGEGVLAMLREEVMRAEESRSSLDLLCNPCDDRLVTSARTRANTTTSSKARSRRSESRPRKHLDDRARRQAEQNRKQLDEQTQLRNRLRGALGFITQYARSAVLPFPLNNVSRDVKLKMKCIDIDEENVNPPTLSILTSPLVSVSKIEKFVLTQLNSRVQEPPQDASTTPKKKAKMALNGQGELDGNYVSVQLYYKGHALGPTLSLYHALIMLRDGSESGNIWEETNVLTYTTIKRSGGPSWSRLLSGRHTPLMAALCEDRHSPFGLFLGISSYVNGWGKTVVSKMLKVLKERLPTIDGNEDAAEVREMLADVMQVQSPPSAESPFASFEDTHQIIRGRVIATDDPEDSSSQISDAGGDSEMEYFVQCVIDALERMDNIINGKVSDDVLVTTRLTTGGQSDLTEDSRHHLQMMVVIYTLLTELSIFTGGTEIRVPFSKRLTLRLLNMLGNVGESLCYQTPAWFIELVLICPRMFSFESRRVLFDVIAAGPLRLLSQFQNRLCAIVDSGNAGSKYYEGHTMDTLDEILRQRVATLKSIKASSLHDIEATLQLPKLKASCSRSDIVRDAAIVMDQMARTVSELDTVPRIEVEFHDEVGVGSGPTQEFYTLVIESIVKGDALGCCPVEELNGFVYPTVHYPTGDWIDDFDLSVFKRASKLTVAMDSTDDRAMFEDPMANDTYTTRVFRVFKLLGQMCASALLDHKMLELRMHPLFWKLCQDPYAAKNCSLYALNAVDPVLARSLKNLLSCDDVAAADLYFTFEGVPLVEGGETLLVTNDNVVDYVRGVIRMRLYDGIRLPVWSFRMGFATVAPLESLSLFTPMELSMELFSTSKQDVFWTPEHLQMHIVPDHGYDVSSHAYQLLIMVLSEFTEVERRQFLRFCTGSPVLPKQGFAGLKPVMRVVKKGDNVDELPSVMTCSNYLKLPNYENVAQLRTKLLQAIGEGQGSFHLS